MLISKCINREEILSIVSKELKEHGIKIRGEKLKPIDNKRQSKKIFKIRLEHQKCENVEYPNGFIAMVPTFVQKACERIEKECKTEGIFRKSGNVKKQHLIKDQFEKTGQVEFNDTHSVIDIASLLKTYFRELPVPLIAPGAIQDALIRCLIHCTNYEEKVDALLMTCLFLPPITINTLAYFLQFLEVISKNSSENFMTIENLVKVITPTIMPLAHNAPEKRLQSHFKIIELLIENSNLIGVVPDRMIIKRQEHLPMTEERKKKKRRSGSLNRVFHGFRKIVGKSSESLDKTQDNAMDDSLFTVTPNFSKSNKKRRLEKLDASSVFSSKKKKDRQMVLSSLPEIDDSPYVPKAEKTNRKSFGEVSSACVEKTSPEARRYSFVPTITLRAINKRTIINELNQMSEKKEDEYVKVSRSEYEAFKTRLNSIETKITHEFNAAKLDAVKAEMSKTDINLNGPEFVECKFHETLKEVEKLEETERNTDQLAKRLSRELKIRPYADNGIIRSPSARKIGSLRRRSSNTRLSRNQSWHLGPSVLNSKEKDLKISNESENFISSLNVYPKPNLKRARIVDGPAIKEQETITLPVTLQSTEKSEKIVPEKPVRKSIQPVNTMSSETWTNATDFFQDPKNNPLHRDDDQETTQQNETLFKTPNRPKKIVMKNEIDLNKTPMLPPRFTPAKRTPMSEKKTPSNKTLLSTPSLNDSREARASIIQIRNQNAGMVAQKAKLFDNLSSDLTKSVDRPVKIPRVVINKTVENVKKMNDEQIPQKNVPLHPNSPRRSSRSAGISPTGINRRNNIRVATQPSPMLKTIKENSENIDRRINILKSDILSEISSPRKRDKKLTPRRNKTPISSKKSYTRHTPSKSPRISRRHHNISFD
ncbi:hypothetical protein PVAND_008669 [Polypedilum vanderplanki]|uniref:Rho-GAP domain-containing protein n=1 Tax=Polypedilum vanderplanki TaxID=319348 RepID=A0A9J6CB09_POLVA|nr:hypothetical protein PVAND_008669 [Polypedilum vanderplanki]